MEVENIVSNGYHGGFLSKIPETQLQKCSDAQTDMDFSLEQKASLRSDPSYVNIELQQSIGPGTYHLDNTYGSESAPLCILDLKSSFGFILFVEAIITPSTTIVLTSKSISKYSCINKSALNFHSDCITDIILL